MPLYDYRCPDCGQETEVAKPIRELERQEICPECLVPMNQVIRPVMVRGDYPGYSCPVTGDWIEGRKAHEENLRKHGARVLEPGESDSVRRFAREQEQNLDREVERTVDELLDKMSGDQRSQLCNEVAAGATCEIVRGA